MEPLSFMLEILSFFTFKIITWKDLASWWVYLCNVEVHFWIYLSNCKSYEGSQTYDPQQNNVLRDFEGWVKSPHFSSNFNQSKINYGRFETFFFFFLKVFNEAVKIVTIIYQKLADILLFYQNHKKVVTFQVRIWKCLQYDDLISDFSFVLPNSLKIRS